MRDVTTPVLDAEPLIEQVVADNGTDDFGGDDWREGLERLLPATAEEAQLNEIGRGLIANDITTYLSARLCITEYRRTHPEVATKDVTPPVVVIGQARTGTTILHDLLAQDPATRVPLSWEVDRPCPPPEADTYDDDPRIDEIESVQSMVDLLIPGFRAMHPTGPRLAQECVRITGPSFRSVIFPTVYRVPSYARWLLHEADLAPAYLWHKTFLQHLQSRMARERWVLKSPGHIWTLPALMDAYPDALLVQTHRDPLRIVASISSLISLLRKLATDEPSITDIASEWVDYIILGLDRSVDARENGTVPADRVVDVQFRDFMSDQIGAIRSIYRRFGWDLTPDVERRMRAFLDANPADKHGAHTYTFEDTGLDEGEVRERVQRYVEYFDVATERV